MDLLLESSSLDPLESPLFDPVLESSSLSQSELLATDSQSHQTHDTFSQLLKKFQKFYCTWRFITVFTRAATGHYPLSE